MPNFREIRGRIEAEKNVSQITRAMEMVSASKMRRAQQRVVATRPYRAKQRRDRQPRRSPAAATDETSRHCSIRPVKVAVILVSRDKGLAGALNSNVIRRAPRYILAEAEYL